MPFVTVMMPVYNGARYIGEAIESVRAQTYVDWELLIVDDGSTDGTLGVIQEHRDRRIRVLYQDHAGEGAARNHALAKATGSLISCLDADDWLLPRALETHVGFLADNPALGATYSDGFWCNERGEILGRISDTVPANPAGDVLDAMVLHPIYGGVNSVTFRREVASAHDVRFDPTLALATDWDFMIRLAEVSQFGYISRPTWKYRRHGNSVSVLLSGQRRDCHARIYRRVMHESYFSEFSPDTQAQFFYQFLLQWLEGRPAEQQEILDSPQFESLPAPARARLLRLVAGKHLMRDEEIGRASRWLEQAVVLDPHDWKNMMVHRLLGLHVGVARLALKTWKYARR